MRSRIVGNALNTVVEIFKTLKQRIKKEVESGGTLVYIAVLRPSQIDSTSVARIAASIALARIGTFPNDKRPILSTDVIINILSYVKYDDISEHSIENKSHKLANLAEEGTQKAELEKDKAAQKAIKKLRLDAAGTTVRKP